MWLSRTVAVSSWRTNIIKLIIHCSREPEALDGTLTTVYWETHHSSAALRRRMKSILIDLPSSLKPINDNHYFPFVHYDLHSSIKKVSNTHFHCVCCEVSLTLSPRGPQQGANISDKWTLAFITLVSTSLHHLTTPLSSDSNLSITLLHPPSIHPSNHPFSNRHILGSSWYSWFSTFLFQLCFFNGTKIKREKYLGSWTDSTLIYLLRWLLVRKSEGGGELH